MRIHTLTLRGIGPFREEQSIDFDEVGHNGVFLLDGPTGVGKSTIVDAIVYALFGTPATEDGQDRMISDFLGHDIPKSQRPFVELTFSTTDGTFRIRREPKSPYVNRNGKAAEHNATVHLLRVVNESADGGTVISTSTQDAGNEVTRLLGLNRRQVLSTIVLAQGQFAKFLTASTEDRRGILQSVFNTQRYEKLQNELVEARKAALRGRDQANQDLREAMAAFLEAAALTGDAAELAAAYRKDEAAVRFLDDRVAELDGERRRLQAELTEAQVAAAQAAADLVAGRQTATAADTKRRLLARRTALMAREAEIDALTESLDVARAAAVIVPSERAMRSREQQYEMAQDHLAQTLEQLSEEHRGLPADGLDALAADLVADRTSLAEALQLEAALPDLATRIGDLTQEIEDLDTSIGDVQSRLNALPEQQRMAQQHCDTLRELAASLPMAEQELRIADEAASLLAEVDSYRDAVVRAKQELIEAHEVAHVAEEELLGARRRYRSGIAAELSRDVLDGDPCPVCGSVEHPRLAQPAADHVGAEEIERLTDQWRILDRLAQAATSDLAAKQAALDAAAVRITCSDPEEAHLARKRAAERVQSVLEAKAELLGAQSRLAELGVQRDQFTDQLLVARERHADRAQALAGLRAQHTEAANRVERARAGFATVALRHAHLTRAIETVAEAAAARRASERFEQSLRDARAAFADEVARSPFDGVAAFRNAVRDEAWLAATQHDIAQFAQDLHAVTEQLQTEAIAAVDETVEVDLARLQTEADAAKAHADQVVGQHAAAGQQFTRARLTRDAVLAARQRCADVECATAAIIRLANIANGQHENLHAVKLATYVVKRRFCDVVDAANSHLTDMSGGRYRLEVSDGPGGSERTYGLGLHVYDDRTDAPRGPSTLSGGETFYVSLALALGLADVVQSESGGISLDTLFVDEGFGSLDPETLDTVMNVLGRLSQGHRTVGLISHVEEMKGRIPDRVEIHRPDPNGPSVIKERLA